jgi:6-phosphogluconolactonase
MDLEAWRTTHFFLADERRVPLEHPESNYRRVRKTLLDPLLSRKQICEDNIHAMDMSLSPRKTAQIYSRELEALNGSFDLALLSAGEDGHVAGIFPKKSYPDKAVFTFFENSPKAPKQRFTASPRLLSGTRFAIVLFAGDAKRDALRHFLDSTAEAGTAKKILKKIANLTILTDQKG